MSNSPNSWTQIRWFLDRGISLIPTRDKQTVTNGRVYEPKTTYRDWGEFQNRIVSEEELWNQMEKYSTESVAMVCGKVSGNLEVIDLDPKNKAGIEILIINDIKELMPTVYERLRIHKTPSGGYHIVYRILGTCPNGSKKISGRKPSAVELAVNLKAKPVYFVETKGEGGYALIPPSLGYTSIRDVEIPIITQAERESLINICLNYNEITKEPKVAKSPYKDLEYYDENPFLHYSRTGDPSELLFELGWKFVSKRGPYLWFTRPGKESGVSGSFNLETRIFWSWSPNWDGEDQVGYFLSTLAIQFKFNKDAKEAYKWLVEKGYGRVKEKFEEKGIKFRASSGKDVPSNFSAKAKEEYEKLKKRFDDIHPYGIFWKIEDTGKATISREKLYEISDKLGFRNYDDQVVQIIDKFVWKRTPREFFDLMKDYIKIEDEEVYEKVFNEYEGFLQRSGVFTMERLTILEDDELLMDTKTLCYKFFNDCWFMVSANEIERLSYDSLNKLVLASKVQLRDAILGESGRYIEFLEHAIDLTKNYDYIQRIIGYLCHEYKDSTMAYIILLTEKCEDPKKGGGTGKNLFCELLQYSTTFLNRPASQSNLDRNFFQSWNGERVMAISDLPKDFEFGFLKELTSGSGVIKKLFRDEKVVPVNKLPKVICQTQYSFEITDGGIARRIIVIEFSDFFTKMHGVDTFFNAMFPDDWNDTDWGGYNMFILRAIQTWLKSGCKLYSNPLSEGGWHKQFKLSYSEVTIDFIHSHWDAWIVAERVTNEQFKHQMDTFFNERGTPPAYRSINKINRAIEEYALRNNVKFDKEMQWRDGNGTTFTGKQFINLIESPF